MRTLPHAGVSGGGQRTNSTYTFRLYLLLLDCCSITCCLTHTFASQDNCGMENVPHERHGMSKAKEYMPGTTEYKEKFGYGPPERALAHVPGTEEYQQTAGGTKVDQMPTAEHSIASRVPGTDAHKQETGDTRTFMDAVKGTISSAVRGGKETLGVFRGKSHY